MASSSSIWEIEEEDDNSTDDEGEESEESTLLNKGKQKMVECPGIPDTFNERMQALLIEYKEGFKKDGNAGKKVMMEWIEDHEDSNNNWGTVITVKLQVDEIGIRLLRPLSDFLFVVWNHEKWSENIERFKSALKWVSEGANSLVIDMILTIVEMIDRGLSKVKRYKEARKKPVKGKLLALFKETEPDDSNQKESSSGSSGLQKLSDRLTQDCMSRLFDKFLEASLHLEAIISHPILPVSGFSFKEGVKYMVEGEFRKCEKAIESAGKDMKKLGITHPLEQVRDDVRLWHTQLSVECEIYQLWRRVQAQASKETEAETKRSDGCCCCS